MMLALCHYFARCDRPADGTVPHPILGDVPTCTRCARVVDVELVPFPADAALVIEARP